MSNVKDPLVTAVDSLTKETTDLLVEYRNIKQGLTGDVNSAASSAKAASDQAGIAATQAVLAKDAATEATNQKTEATKQAVLAKASADKASQVSGLDTVAEAVQVALADSYQYAMTKADFDANREQNKDKYAGSGWIEWGKQYDSTAVDTSNVNEGLDCVTSIQSIIRMGYGIGNPYYGGVSRSSAPIINVDGVVHHLKNIHKFSNELSYIKFPTASDATKSYDSETGIVTDHLTYLDPKYPDADGNPTAALSHNDAISRCFEGVIKNGDFRLGTEGWRSVYGDFTFTDGVYTIDNEASWISVIVKASVKASVKYQVFFDVVEKKSYNKTWGANGVDFKFEDQEEDVFAFTFTPTADANEVVFSVTGAPNKISLRGISIRPVTSAPILTRQDLVFVEVNPNAECTVFKPLGNNQYGATTADGITLKKLTDLGISQSVSGFGAWDSETVGYGELISSLTDAQLKTVLSNPQNNIRFDPIQNKLLQSEYKICVEEGNNDTDTVDERMTKLGYVKDAVDVTRYNHSDGRQAIGVCLRQTLNSGAYHPVFNPSGCGYCKNASGTAGNWYATDRVFTSAKGCMVNVVGGIISSSQSGRPTSFPDAYFDAVYAHQIKDLRLSAHKQDVNKLRVDTERKDVAGESRGWGKVPFTQVSVDMVWVSGMSTSNSYICRFTSNNKLVERGAKGISINQNGERRKVLRCYSDNGNQMVEFEGASTWNGGQCTLVAYTYLTPQNDTLAWTDLVGSPSAISATFPNGVQGMWAGLTKDEMYDYPLNRKCSLSSSSVFNLLTTNNGTTWRSGNIPVNTTTNKIEAGIKVSDVWVIQYPALANFTQPADNSKVVGEVGDVTVTTRHEVNQGNRLQESLLGSIGKDTSNALTDVSKARQTTMLIEHVPHGFNAPANNSTGCKVATSIIEKDGLLYSQYQAVEIVNNGTDWGDTSNAIPVVNNDSTHTDDNGITVKVVNHIGQIPLGIASYSDSSQSTK